MPNDMKPGEKQSSEWVELSKALGGVLSLGIALSAQWGNITPAWLRSFFTVSALGLGLVLTLWFALPPAIRFGEKVSSNHRARAALRGLIPSVDRFVADLQKVANSNHVYCLAALVGHLNRDAGIFEEMLPTSAGFDVLRQWISSFGARWGETRKHLRAGAMNGILIESRFILDHLGSIARQCEKHIPPADDSVELAYDGRGPSPEIRNVWRQFRHNFNTLLADFADINRRCAPHIGVSEFAFDRL